ncbi:class I SAM-dependent methyltransferase [Amycolatopsis sp. K13G38]|uniref:Class I SAM-dependent methyltransferase n=1 Tax=Amycolatopsis acididurans TaxID=2724524 RepID=A0ABX1J9T9_9PSEU|nr:class I SAM-dependent methyltransferase [Amycolatopsis acididurans]NKQ55105.1 class I SAM-dependent methyltransferase [Amycolatopsis acididurans]
MALREWRELLAAWTIPEDILAKAPDSPWVLPREVFVRRVDRQLRAPLTPTHELVLDALGDGGTLIDVGSGAGAASLPCAKAITHVTAVDSDTGLLAKFVSRAIGLGLPYAAVRGSWPAAAGDVEVADVVVCGHVLYNVPDLAPFVAALNEHARRRVVVELAEVHPLTELNDLWRRFHGIERPSGPTADDAAAALRELGVEPEILRWQKQPAPEYERFDELVEVTRRRLCLPDDRADEVADALRETGIDETTPPDLGSSGRAVATLSWSPERSQ